MASAISEIRALLVQFERSALHDFYLRSPDWSVFMAREGGSANPMLASGDKADGADLTAPSVAVLAPHLGLFEPACAIFDVVGQGALIGRIDVLGRITEVFSTQSGRVKALSVPVNGLVEFGDKLVEITAAG
jgi:predicted deacylase